MKASLNMIEKATLVALTAHEAVGQKRKYSGVPYIVHPKAVADIVHTVEGHTEEMIAAALLHDVVEDTEIKIEFVYAIFGDIVGVMVAGLTDVSKLSDGNRAKRKKIDREHTWRQDARTQTIKVADLIDNMSDIAVADKKFAPVFIREKRLTLAGMIRADSKLISEAWWNIYEWDLKNDAK